MLTRSRILGFAVVAAVVVGGAATGAALARQDGASPIQAALAKTAAAGSSRFTFAFTVSGVKGLPGGGGAISLTGSGASDTKHGNASLSLNLGALAKTLGAAAGGTSLPPTIDVVVVHNVVYVHLAALAKQLSPTTPGKEWLKIDAKSLPKSATGGANLGQLSTLNPQQALAALSNAVSVKKLGSAKVRGTATTHYAGTLDLTRLSGVVPKAQQSSFAQSLKKAGLTTVPFDVWIDGHSLLSRLSVRVDHLKAGTAGTASIRASFDIFDYGVKLKIAAPPASKTVDAGKLLAGLAGGTG
jgi:hypothetical protein